MSDPHPLPSASVSPPPPDPKRFAVSRGTLRLDRFMNRFIVVGGLGVIAAVFGIFAFILAEVLPLFHGAKVGPPTVVSTGVSDPVAVGADEWTELPFVLSANGDLIFVERESGEQVAQTFNFADDFRIASTAYDQENQIIAVGGTNGSYTLISLNYQATYPEGAGRKITAAAEAGEPSVIARATETIRSLDFREAGNRRVVAAIAEDRETAQSRLLLETFTRKRTLFGAGPFTSEGTEELTGELPGAPVGILVGSGGESLLVRLADESVMYWRRTPGGWQVRQNFRPFEPGEKLSSMHFIQGEVSVNFTSEGGGNLIYSLTPTAEGLRYRHTRTLPQIEGAADLYAASVRNKAYLLGSDSELSLRYATTEKVRWNTDLEKPLASVFLSGKYDAIVTLDTAGELAVSPLHDPHPEAGLRTFFGKVWYEGQAGPAYIWQSTGGSDDFEPKLSLVPLIAGSLKGTFYALLFAVPIALLAAIYTSQFLRPGLKRIVKPTMEIMASLPSVVLGFLGALWLAPILEERVPSVLLIVLAIPTGAVLAGYLWNRFPVNIRSLLPGGMEFVVFLPLLCLVGWTAWQLGPLLENLVFTVSDPATGQTIADFRLWWSEFSGSTFQQRNSLVVGLMMGFAVIPIIFTIAEDALSNVPQSLVSGSLALGASRWQTAARVVLPTASAGIFSALMIGLGRAVGETMIVVMATGNTPIMDFDIFNGMRTLSANLAVELPEAAHGATLYRTLFLGALVLFLLTFAVNTLAEVMRHRLRDRYKVIS